MTTYLVVDASFTYNLIIPNAHQVRIQELITNWKKKGITLCAPTLWGYEITSSFTKMVRYGHLTESDAQAGLNFAYKLDIQLMPPDEALANKAYKWTTRLNRAAAYDSFYLALAETLGCELWTMDKRLYNAVNQPWVRLGNKS